jgi:hypothetical protein
MNTKMLTAGFTEIPLDRQEEIQGGIVPFLAAIGIAMIAEVITDWDNFKNGLMGRPEE